MNKILSTTLFTTLFCQASFAQPVSIQVMLDNVDRPVHGSINNVNLSESGRYVAFVTEESNLFVRDIKTQTSSLIDHTVWSNSVGISPNGRFIVYMKSNMILLDRIHQRTYVLNNMSPARWMAPIVSDEGKVAYNVEGSEDLMIYTHSSKRTVTLPFDGIPKGFSVDSTVLNYIATDQNGNYQSYLYHTQTHEVTPLSNHKTGDVYSANISKDGNISAWLHNNILYKKNLTDGSVSIFKLADFNIIGRSTHAALLEDSLALSFDGRYIAFNGAITAQHPDYNTNGTFYSNRSFRVDTYTSNIIVTSKTYDGTDIDGSLINTDIHLSADGNIASFATSIENLAPGIRQSAEEPHHAYISGGYDRNYLFIELPHSENQWNMFQPMRLVADHQWEGYVYFDGQGKNEFKFDMGGNWITPCAFEKANNWSHNFGDQNNDGMADANGKNIIITQGAGHYRITLNDATKAYDVSKVIHKQFDNLWLRGSFNGWHAQNSLKMTYKGKQVWEAVVTFGNEPHPSFKFDRYNDWRENYGQSHVENQATQSGENITVDMNSTYLVRFYENTKRYIVQKVVAMPTTSSPQCGTSH